MRQSIGFALFYFLISGQVWAAASLPPDLKITIPNPPAEVEFGEEVAYEFLIENIGEDSSNDVSVAMGVSAEGSVVSVESAVGTCEALVVAQGTKITCELGIVAPLVPITVTLVVKAPEVATTLQINASVSALGENISTNGDNDIFASTQVVAPPDTPVDDGGGDDGGNAGADDDGAEAAGGQGGCSLNPGELASPFAALGLILGALAFGVLRLRARPTP
ncbi:hypothetical protein FBR05_14200 [Deltaproteobacteria bacterium PRO3]|nr:hypothetical protein [Deltaproteobacteria bacterium PRO3]